MSDQPNPAPEPTAAPAAAPAPAPVPASAAPTPAPVAGDPPPSPQPVAGAHVRPEGIPDDLWDDATGLKVGETVSKLREAQAKIAEAETARGEVPTEAKGYELAVPESVTIPEGFRVDLDPADPFMQAAQADALAAGLSKAQWNAVLGLEAKRQLAAQEKAVSYYAAEKTKLGANADARITSAKAWMDANLSAADAAALKGTLYGADQVKAYEALIALRAGPKLAPSTTPPGGRFENIKPGAGRLAAINEQRLAG